MSDLYKTYLYLTVLNKFRAPPKEQPRHPVSATARKLEHICSTARFTKKSLSEQQAPPYRMSTILDLVAIFGPRCILAHPASPGPCNFLCFGTTAPPSGKWKLHRKEHFASLSVVRVRHCFKGSCVWYPSNSTCSSNYSLVLYAAKRLSKVPTHGVSVWWLY